jgi:hypothetical protein
MQFSAPTRHFIPLRYKYSRQHPVLKHAQSCSSDQVLQPREPQETLQCFIF